MTVKYSDFKDTPMPFGKYKGQSLKNIPLEYIEWCILNIQDQGLCIMFAAELQRRKPSWRK